MEVFCQNITSSLEATNRDYFCPREVVTYMCTGSGNQISLYAPPQVSVGQRLSYFSSDAAGRRLISNKISTTLVDTSPFVVDLIVQDTSLTGLNITCVIDSENQIQRAHRVSGMLSCRWVLVAPVSSRIKEDRWFQT